MQKHSKQSKVSIKRFLCVSILIIGISIFSSMRVNATTVSYDSPSYSALTPHDPIYITSDSGLAAFPGSGTGEDPYIIEGYNITTASNIGIYISGTTKYFTVRNCYVDANQYGISISNVAAGTATVINNTCNNNGYNGIKIDSSENSTVANNMCNNNENGIGLVYSGSSTVANNTCNNNTWEGIWFVYSGGSTAANNTCNYNNNGINLDSSGSSTVANSACSNNNNHGIDLDNSDSSMVANNTCNNNWNGIAIYSSDSCVFTYNLLQENERHGFSLNPACDNNLIHHNNFVDNNLVGISQADDDGTDNYWYDTETSEGNYWDDWSGTGTYAIDGTAGSIDLYPLDEPVDIDPPLIVNIIHSPATSTEIDVITVNATVTDDSDVQSVTLHYRVNDGTWIDVSMTLISGDLYSVTIGSFAVSDTIDYYITAIDNSTTHNEATADNGGLYYVITVGSSDVTGPTIDNIVHTPATPTNLDSISINTTVTDDSGIHNVTLHFRINSGTWTEVSMTLIIGSTYSVTIGSFSVGDPIEYYVSAVDNSVNQNEATDDNSGLYYSFTVVEVISEFQIFPLLLPTMTFLFLGFGLVVLQRRKK